MTHATGTKLGRYEIRAKLGEGGMGEVYLAQDTKLNRKVAIKLLPPHSTDSEQANKRLLREARAAATLDHPNICTIHEVGEADGRSFIVMQYVEGETLDIRLKRKQLSLVEALTIATQVSEAISEAHVRGIIHRDIKPQNIMITSRGQAKVMDFGLAKAMATTGALDAEADTRTLLTTPGTIVGTVPYMSPEQVRGESLDERSDIFSFGVMLYETLSGRQPFATESAAATASAILTKEPLPLARFAPEIPEELQRIVGKCLEKDRNLRYQSARELSIDVHHLQKKSDQASVAAEQLDARRQSNLRHYVLAAITIMILAGLGIGVYRLLTGRKSISSVAVLPFARIDADPDTEYLSDGITDSIIDRLSHLPGLKVMSHNAVFRYKGRETDAQAVGRELGVEAVLTGRLVKHNDALTINLELVDARDNSHIWGEQYDHKLSDVLTLQREIPVDISEKLRLPLSGESKERLTKQYTQNTEAYQLYLKGRLSWEKWTLDGTKKAIEYFQEAIKEDPNYALAYSGLADAYTVAPYGTGLSLKEAHRRAREAATKALSLDPALGEPHAALAEVLFYEDWDFAGAEREFKRAIELSPSYAEGHHMYSHFLLTMGRIDESLVESRKFLDLDPLSPAPNLHLGYQYLYARQYDLSVQQHLKTLEMDPNSARAHDQLGDTYYQKGMFAEAVAEYLKEKGLSGAAQDDITALKHAYSASGIKGYLHKQVEQFLAIRARQGQGLTVGIAAQYSRLGDKDKTFEWLETAYGEHASSLVHLREELAFDNVRSDPRFADLLRRIGLPL